MTRFCINVIFKSSFELPIVLRFGGQNFNLFLATQAHSLQCMTCILFDVHDLISMYK